MSHYDSKAARSHCTFPHPKVGYQQEVMAIHDGVQGHAVTS